MSMEEVARAMMQLGHKNRREADRETAMALCDEIETRGIDSNAAAEDLPCYTDADERRGIPWGRLLLVADGGAEMPTRAMHELRGERTATVGRSRRSDVWLPFSWVSRVHCSIALLRASDIFPGTSARSDERAAAVRDAGSSNGTSVNGTPLEPMQYRPLFDGDAIGIGNTTLVFRDPRLDPAIAGDSELAAASWSRSVERRADGSSACEFPFAASRGAGPFAGSAVPGRGARGPGRSGERSGMKTFRLIRMLGRGPCAAVYLSADDETGAAVALKIVDKRAAALSAFALEHYSREARVIEAVGPHESIVGIVGGGETEDALFLALEYCACGDLQAHVENRHPRGMGEPACRHAFAQLLRGVERIHAAGVAHRDLKPGNILLARIEPAPDRSDGPPPARDRDAASDASEDSLRADTSDFVAPGRCRGEQDAPSTKRARLVSSVPSFVGGFDRNSTANEFVTLKIADFGVAATGGPAATDPRARPCSAELTACGTPGYIAPEMLPGSVRRFSSADDALAAAKAADAWSLGAILRFMLTGSRPPIHGGSPLDRMALFARGISRGAVELAEQLLSADPARRPKPADVVSRSSWPF